MNLHLIKKEIRELLTRSTLLFIVAMALIFAMMGQILSSSQKDASTKAIVAVVDQDGSSYAATVVAAMKSGANVIYEGNDSAKAEAQLVAKKGIAMITLPSGFGQKISSGVRAEVQVLWLAKGTGLVDSTPVSTIQGLIFQASQALSSRLVKENTTIEGSMVGFSFTKRLERAWLA